VPRVVREAPGEPAEPATEPQPEFRLPGDDKIERWVYAYLHHAPVGFAFT